MNRIATLKEYRDVLNDAGLVVQSLRADDLLCAEVLRVTYDSRESEAGTLFVCKGAAFKESYIVDAMERGAVAWVSEQAHDVGGGIVVSDIRKAMAVLANYYYDEPWQDFPLIGLAGTKGKTTTLYFLKNIIEAATNRPEGVGFLSSVETYDGRQRFESHLTTPEALVLAQHFDCVRETGLWGMVMEVSSQALKYDRTLGVVFDIGCFLNFGVDHIGENEHVDEEDYFTSKLKFFDQCALVCLNAETDGLERTLDRISRSSTCKRLVLFSPGGLDAYGGHSIDYAACDIRMRDGLTEFSIHKRKSQDSNLRENTGVFSLSIRGLFNVENALAAAVVAFELGLPVESIRQGLLETSVAGRMEVFENKERHVVVIVDYAHNRMSFERLYESTKKEYPGWRIEAIFGCPGGKGLQRRKELPDIAASYADFTWITEEDAGEEDVLAISAGLAERLAELDAPARIVLDREEAIRAAIEGAGENTVIVLTGKGRENYQKRGREYVPVESDVELVAKYLWK